MSYTRVIPRDFFNEAKLLKCMGKLALNIHDGYPLYFSLQLKECGEPFDIVQNDDDGSLYIMNYPLKLNGDTYYPWTPYNSKDNYPLYITGLDGDDVRVFDEEGNFSKGFIKTFSQT